MLIAGARPGLLLAIGAILGAIVGSFLGTVACGCRRAFDRGRALGVRWLWAAAGAARSRADPSWLALRGRCRHCGASIGTGQLVAEAGGALVGALAAQAARRGSSWPAGDGSGLATAVAGAARRQGAVAPLAAERAAGSERSGLGCAGRCRPRWHGPSSAAGWAMACWRWSPRYRRWRGARAAVAIHCCWARSAPGWGRSGCRLCSLGAAGLGLAVAGLMRLCGRPIRQRCCRLTFLAVAAWPVFVFSLA
jgi:leader peptidase (prepilin peptidase)/N-methyltransferase